MTRTHTTVPTTPTSDELRRQRLAQSSQALAEQQGLHGPSGSVASTPTVWRAFASIDTHSGLASLISPPQALH